MKHTWVGLAALAIASGCAYVRPLPTTEQAIAGDVARGFARVYPDAEVGLMRPRFGIPAVLEGSTSFPIAVLERGARPIAAALVTPERSDEEAGRCLAGEGAGCVPLALEDGGTRPVEGGYFLHTYVAHAEGASARKYDLLVKAADRPLERARSSVYVRPPAVGDALSVVQLSDLHVGRPDQRELVAARLRQIVREVNALAPDVVIVTGDMAEEGHTAALEHEAAAALRELDAPVLVIIGNHDYGHFPRVRTPERPDHGFYNFARAFHAYRFARTTIGRWDFIGFDSGPSIFSPAVRTRGLSVETLAQIEAALAEAATAGRGAILFSHAPTRAAMSSDPERRGARGLGTMRSGGAALEELMTDASRRGQRVLHLSGHTHWSDLFAGDGAGFSRLPFARLCCPLAFEAPVLLVNAPSATRITFPTLEHGQHFGFVRLSLDGRRSVVQFHLFDAAGRARVCSES